MTAGTVTRAYVEMGDGMQKKVLAVLFALAFLAVGAPVTVPGATPGHPGTVVKTDKEYHDAGETRPE
ncbi:hypothetical protein ACQP00_23955 [Dactylosporangium sp. CS-047395]|uniref:hypothetical protein n=1 Tax=Dactylosporangium sp. CS-047395 TaxID=3239936 RepID=UPI003D921C1E